MCLQENTRSPTRVRGRRLTVQLTSDHSKPRRNDRELRPEARSPCTYANWVAQELFPLQEKNHSWEKCAVKGAVSLHLPILNEDEIAAKVGVFLAGVRLGLSARFLRTRDVPVVHDFVNFPRGAGIISPLPQFSMAWQQICHCIRSPAMLLTSHESKRGKFNGKKIIHARTCRCWPSDPRHQLRSDK